MYTWKFFHILKVNPSMRQDPPPIDWAAWKKELDPELVSAFEKAYTSAPSHLIVLRVGLGN